MVETLVLKAGIREITGTRTARRLREKGLLPAIIYGHQVPPVAVQLNYHDLALELQHHHRLLEVELENKKERFLVKDVQYDHLGEKILHVDLARVYLDERVTVTVSVELKGTPKGTADGGVLDQLLTEVELECLVTNIPESIRVSVINLEVGHTLTAGEIELPSGTKLVTDPEAAVVVLRLVTAEAVEEVIEEEEVEPEVITAREKEEDQEKETKE